MSEINCRGAGRPAVRFVVIVAAAAALAACTSPTGDWSTAQSPKENRIDWITFDHVVRFTGRGSTLSTTERRRLEKFLAEISAGYGDRVMVGAPGSKSTEEAGRVAGIRESSVISRLRQMRLSPTLLPSDGDIAPWDGSVTVVVGRYVVTPPDCPDWSKPATGDPANRVSSNYGCATTSNLGLMVANPGDLVRGRALGPSDGEAAARAIQRYREGKTKDADKESTLKIGSGN